MALSKLLGRNRYIKTNTQKGSKREGQKYVDVRVGDDISHRYGLNGGKPEEVKWNKATADLAAINKRLSPDKPEAKAATATAVAAASAASKVAAAKDQTANAAAGGSSNGLSKALQRNQIKGSSRFGKAYKTEIRGGREVHVYADGQVVAAKKRK